MRNGRQDEKYACSADGRGVADENFLGILFSAFGLSSVESVSKMTADCKRGTEKQRKMIRKNFTVSLLPFHAEKYCFF